MALSEILVARLIDAARNAGAVAYCPYSQFKVGAAVMSEDGSIFTGANVENASYGLTMCAERVAIFNAIASGKRSLLALVVYTPTDSPTAPCGACRQVLHEFGPRAEVVCACKNRYTVYLSMPELLPRAFGPGDLA